MTGDQHGFGVDRLRPWSTYGFLKAVGVFYVTTAILHLALYSYLGLTDWFFIIGGVVFWPSLVPLEGIRLGFGIVGVVAGLGYYQLRRPA